MVSQLDLFIFTESIAEAIVNIASLTKLESRHENLSKHGPKLEPCGHETCEIRGRKFRKGAIQNYLELGEDASREPYSGLASACSMVLRGEGANSPKSECLATISWQETQMMAAMSVIDLLLYKDLISRL